MEGRPWKAYAYINSSLSQIAIAYLSEKAIQVTVCGFRKLAISEHKTVCQQYA
jgi:hypothetical protein